MLHQCFGAVVSQRDLSVVTLSPASPRAPLASQLYLPRNGRREETTADRQGNRGTKTAALTWNEELLSFQR